MAREIIRPLEASPVISDAQSFRCVATTDEFWESAQKHAR